MGAIAFRIIVRATDGGVPDSNLYFTLIGNFDWFVLGMFLALASVVTAGAWSGGRRWSGSSSGGRRSPGSSPRCCSGRSRRRWGSRPPFPQNYTAMEWLWEHLFYGAIAFFLLLPAVFGDSLGGFPRVVLRNRVLAWLGLISYGIFLWHHPIVGEMATSATGATGASWA